MVEQAARELCQARGGNPPELQWGALTDTPQQVKILIEGVDPIEIEFGADKTLVTRVEVFDLYEGKGIEEGKKSLAIAVTLQPTDRTLTDPEIEAVGHALDEALAVGH